MFKYFEISKEGEFTKGTQLSSVAHSQSGQLNYVNSNNN